MGWKHIRSTIGKGLIKVLGEPIWDSSNLF